MATINYGRPISSYNINDWDRGFNISSNSSLIRFTDGRHNMEYSGSFTYSGNQLSGGTLKSITWSDFSTPYLSVSDINADISSWLSAINNGQGAAIGTAVFNGNDFYMGSSGNDDIYTYGGDDTYNGGAGIDTVHYQAVSTDGSGFTVTPIGSSFKVSGGGKNDTMVNVERIDFGDGSTLALDIRAGENAGSAYRLYQAAFDRKPDTAGLKFWTEQLDKGASLAQVAQGFVASNEFKTINPSNDPASLVNSYYMHVLHRPADADGAKFWVDAMNKGMTSNQLLVAFSESQENINSTTPSLEHGVWLV